MQRLKVAAEQAKRELSQSDEAASSPRGLGDHGPGGKPDGPGHPR